MPQRGKAIFTKPFVSRRKRNCRSCLSSRTTVTASAVRPAKSIRARLTWCSRMIGANSTAQMLEKCMGRPEEFAHILAGKEEGFFCVLLDKVCRHTSSAEHKLYRSADE